MTLSETDRAGHLGLWFFLATVTMLFAGFTSAMLVRRTAADWQPLPVPPLLWINTGVLAVSSLTMERARRQARARSGSVAATALLGLLFLVGQVAAWRQLVAQGLFLSSNPHSSFFYILTGAHGVHLLGGLFALGYLLARRRGLNLCATYWHFLGALWIYLFAALFVM